MSADRPPVSVAETSRHLLRASLRNRHDLALAVLHPLGAICIGIIAPYLIGKIFAGISTGAADVERLFVPLALAMLAGVTANRFGFRRVLTHQAKTMRDLQAESLQVLLKRNVGFHTNQVSGKLVSDALDYPNAYSQLSNAIFINIIPFTIVLVSGIIIVWIHSWIMGLALAGIVTVTIGWSALESRKRSLLRVERLRAMKAVTSHMSDTIVNAQTVKTFAREDDEAERHAVLSEDLLRRRLNDWSRAGNSGSNRMAALLFMQLGFIMLIVYLIRRDPSLLAVGIFSFTYTITLINRLFEITTIIRQIEDGFLQSSPMIEIIREQPEILDKPSAAELHISHGAIDFNKVSFHYPDTSKHQAVFRDLDLHIEAGEKIGLVGPSGGGKSTLTRLLLRFEDVQSGSISIDGQKLTDITQRSLHQAIGYVPQEPLLFHRSIRENIAYGNNQATDSDIEHASRQAYALEFIRQLPQGMDTIVGERGIKLSGGQRQRIAIARAILKDAPILVLDEATSALDSESEIVIQKALDALMQGRTAIVVAHRLSTIQKMDRIVVLDDGKIIEQGSHRELLAAGGLYATLWKHQSGGFIEE